MKSSIILLLCGLIACAGQQPITTAPLVRTETVVVEKQVCGRFQCGMVGDLYCGFCEDLKGHVCEENTCKNFCVEMKVDERCFTLNSGWYKHQFSYRCHAHFEKATCATMSDSIYPEDSVRCCHFASDDEPNEDSPNP